METLKYINIALQQLCDFEKELFQCEEELAYLEAIRLNHLRSIGKIPPSVSEQDIYSYYILPKTPERLKCLYN